MTSPEKAKKVQKSVIASMPAIKTPQDLIHIRHYISILQYKYWVLLLRAYRDAYDCSGGHRLTDEEYCYLPMNKVVEHLGYLPKLSEIESDLEALRRESIAFNALSKDGEKIKEGTGFVTSWMVSPSKIGVVFPPILRRSVENLNTSGAIFQMLNWQIFNSFNGKAEAVLYKLCKDYVGVGRTPYMSVESFRLYMGIKDSEYKDFKRLNQWVISGPIRCINKSELSDIEVEVEFKREMRRIVGMHFKISPSAKGKIPLALGDDPAFSAAQEYISITDQRRYLRLFTFIELSIARANEYIAEQQLQGKSVNVGALYRKAIEGEWGRTNKVSKALENESPAKKEVARDSKQCSGESAAPAASDHQARQLERQELESRVQLADAIKALTPEQIRSQVCAYQAEGQLTGKNSTLSYSQALGSFGDAVERTNFKIWQRKQIQRELTGAAVGG